MFPIGGIEFRVRVVDWVLGGALLGEDFRLVTVGPWLFGGEMEPCTVLIVSRELLIETVQFFHCFVVDWV